MDVKAKFMEIRLEGNGRILGPLIAVVPGLGKKYLEGMRRINDARTNELLNVAEKHKQIQERFSSGGVNIKTELTLDKDGINQKITLPVLDRIQNFEAVVDKAESMVGENTIEDKPMDDNWKAQFYDAVVDISLEDTQEIWARVLAREIQNPGSTSTRALGILKTLDKSTAQIFEKICSMCFVFGVGPYIFDARVPCLSGNAGNNVLQKYGLTFGDLNCLQEHTLVISNYNSQHDYMVLTTGKKIEQQNQMSVIPFQFQGKLWVLNATQEFKGSSQIFKVKGIALTMAGRDLSRVVNIKPNDDFMDYTKQQFLTHGLEMVEVPRELLDNTYENRQTHDG